MNHAAIESLPVILVVNLEKSTERRLIVGLAAYCAERRSLNNTCNFYPDSL